MILEQVFDVLPNLFLHLDKEGIHICRDAIYRVLKMIGSLTRHTHR